VETADSLRISKSWAFVVLAHKYKTSITPIGAVNISR
jgi:hypothetical protein